MELKTKKRLAARVLGVGLERVMFEDSRLEEIKEALTRQDIKDLVKSGAIKIKAVSGRRTKKKRKTKKRAGKIRQKVNRRKELYVILTRKLRKILKAMKKAGTISRDKYFELRKQIKSKSFKTKGHLMEAVNKK